MDIKIGESWKLIFKEEFDKTYFKTLTKSVKQAYQNSIVYPLGKQIFAAFEFCTFDNIKVVIIGQDPYHGPGQANGLCFSVNDGITIPPSLKNIFKEIQSNLNLDMPQNGNLERWAKQGVLLLNSILTVKANTPSSHKNLGWEIFTDAVIRKISELKENIVFVLWGSYAQKKGNLINKDKHLVLMSPHPSPFSADRGFFGNKHFSKTNEFLISKNMEIINW